MFEMNFDQLVTTLGLSRPSLATCDKRGRLVIMGPRRRPVSIASSADGDVMQQNSM